MAHKTLIGGTAYEISGGKTLVSGTAYSIDKGKTLVGGTAYEVGFGAYTPIYDFGTITPSTLDSIGYQYQINLTANGIAVPDLSQCTHIMVNGELFEVSYQEVLDGMYIYRNLCTGEVDVLNATNPYEIKLVSSTVAELYILNFYSYTSGTFTASIGKFE